MKESDFIEKCIKSTKVFSGKLLHVYSDRVEVANGYRSIREYIKHPGAAVVIPYTGNGKIFMIRQFRYPIGRTMIELPAGKIDPGEDSETTIKREIGEETGYEARTMIKLRPIHTCIGYSNELIDLFWASDLFPSNHQPDPDEKIELMEMTISAAMELIYTGQITDSKTLIGLFWAEKIFRDKSMRDKFQITL